MPIRVSAVLTGASGALTGKGRHESSLMREGEMPIDRLLSSGRAREAQSRLSFEQAPGYLFIQHYNQPTALVCLHQAAGVHRSGNGSEKSAPRSSRAT